MASQTAKPRSAAPKIALGLAIAALVIGAWVSRGLISKNAGSHKQTADNEDTNAHRLSPDEPPPPAPQGRPQALVPLFDKPKDDPSIIAHYAQQVFGSRTPTLADWQKLSQSVPADVHKMLNAPLGTGHFVMSMCLDLQGCLWVGTEGEGVYRYDSTKPAMQQWQHFTTKDGLGDDNGYALACDQQGRIWAGHLNHGVSVYNGEKWQTYEVVADLSRPDTLSGPLGERIFHITVAPSNAGVPPATFTDPLTGQSSPIAGSIWMCTSAGLAAYFPATDTWSYITRADGLPSDQANSLAFAPDGTLYLATQCDGIAIANPSDHYKSWKQVVAPGGNPRADGVPVADGLPTTGTGPGLPTNLMNDILVAKDGTVYAATTAGIAWSMDKGSSWQFMRGADYADKVKNRFEGAPADWVPDNGPTLTEDNCTCVAEDGKGNIHVGHPSAEDVLTPQAASIDSTSSTPASCMLASPVGLVHGGYGQGLVFAADARSPQPFIATASPSPSMPFPSGQSGAAAEKARRALAARPQPQAAIVPIAFLGEDWATQGDWVGRYGRQYSNLCAANSPMDHVIPLGMVGTNFSLKAKIGDHAPPGEGKRNWLFALSTTDPSSLYDPFVGVRREGQWDDHGEAYPRTFDGPNLQMDLTLPEGLYRVSLYFHDQDRNSRDLLILAGAASSDGGFKPLVRTRIAQFHNGGYKQFLLVGSTAYHFEIHKEYSKNTIIEGVFIDRLTGPPNRFDNGPLGCMGHVRYDPPAIPPTNKLPAPLVEVVSYWQNLNDPDLLGAAAPNLKLSHILAYRVVGATNPSSNLLCAWRWSMPLWSLGDREEWLKTMDQGWKSFLEVNGRSGPQIKNKD